MRINTLLVGLLLLGLMSGCSLYDLRPEIMSKENSSNENVMKAKQLIAESAHVHGWDSIGNATLTATYSDEWPGFLLRTFFRPWPASSVMLKHTFGTQDLYASSVELMDGKKKGEIWGLTDKQTYKIIAGQKQVKKDDDILFYLPAYQYFTELGLWAKDIPLVTYLGEQKIKEKTYQIVFGSWNRFEPQKDVDQYLFYFEKDTKRLGIVEYTIRDAMANAHGANWYTDFRSIDGLLIPFRQTITGGIDDDNIVHQVIMSEFKVAKE